MGPGNKGMEGGLLLKPRAFFFHYNKPASLAAKRPVISVHQDKVCHLTGNVDCRVPVQGRIRKTQPYFVMAGKGCVRVDDKGTAMITKN